MAVLIEWGILVLVVAPAVAMALLRSMWLVDYTIVVLAFNRGLRRIVDYYVNDQFNPQSPISLSPLLVAMLLLVPVVLNFRSLAPRVQRMFEVFIVTLVLGFLAGFIYNRFAAIYGLAEWLSAFAAMAFAATQPATRAVADRWIKTAGWAAMGVAAYGWWQYYTIPVWDAMWLEQSGMQGYMGQPIPTQMTLFSTMNERGPCATFLAWAAIPMILDRRWRNVGGWLSVAFLLATIFLTGTRSMFVITALVAVVYPALARGRGVLQLLMLGGLLVVTFTYLVDKIPGAERFSQRYEADSLYGEGSSFKGRLEIYRMGAIVIATNPLGLGLGSSGMGKRADANKGESIQTVGDSGYVQMFTQFGWAGGVCFFAMLWMLWRELTERWQRGVRLVGPDGVDRFIPVARALLIGSIVFLFVGNIFAGFSLIWLVFGRAIARETVPEYTRLMSRPDGRGPGHGVKATKVAPRRLKNEISR